MSRRILVLALMPTFLLLTACGGGKTSSTASQSSAAASRSSAGASSSTKPRSAFGGASAHSGLPPGVTNSPASRAGAVNVRVPATFIVRPGETLYPATVSSPGFIAILLTVVSADGRSHHVALRTPTTYSLTVPAGGRASIRVPGLKQGRYPLQVDGATRGALIIGGEPGP